MFRRREEQDGLLKKRTHACGKKTRVFLLLLLLLRREDEEEEKEGLDLIALAAASIYLLSSTATSCFSSDDLDISRRLQCFSDVYEVRSRLF